MMNKKVSGPWQEDLVEIVRELYSVDGTGHDFYHSIRVKNLTVMLQSKEGGDLDVLLAAAYLHDVGRVLEKATNRHAFVAAEAAPALLAKTNFPEDKYSKVVVCIRYHDLYADKTPAEWVHFLELQILQDADRLDAVGAIGIARTFTFGGATAKPIWVPGSKIDHNEWTATAQSQNTILHFYEKLLKISDYLNTKTAKAMASGRIGFMQEFLDQFFDEWDGKK